MFLKFSGTAVLKTPVCPSLLSAADEDTLKLYDYPTRQR